MTEFPWKSGLLREWITRHERETIDLMRQMVERESPSGDVTALDAFAQWFAGQAKAMGAAVEISTGGHLLCRWDPPGAAGRPILILGHYDTVWPIGTLPGMPWREAQGRLWGPGVLDMKGGVAMALMAIRALRELAVPMLSPVLLQLNADEEIGSHSSRALTESMALASRAVLVVEPGTGLAGKLKTARKGVGDYRLRVTGIAAHAGVDFSAGASAILELARQLMTISAFTDLERGITVNPGVVSGGTRGNVIAAEARAQIDVRVARRSDAAWLDAQFRGLQPFDLRCHLHVEGGLNRPPMERSEAGAALFAKAKSLALDLGVELEESSTGGGSDGNFTAALGVPTLDGVGAVGEGAHAAHESILIDRIGDRTALLAALLATLGAEPGWDNTNLRNE